CAPSGDSLIFPAVAISVALASRRPFLVDIERISSGLSTAINRRLIPLAATRAPGIRPADRTWTDAIFCVSKRVTISARLLEHQKEAPSAARRPPETCNNPSGTR